MDRNDKNNAKRRNMYVGTREDAKIRAEVAAFTAKQGEMLRAKLEGQNTGSEDRVKQMGVPLESLPNLAEARISSITSDIRKMELREAVDCLSGREKAVVHLFVFEGLSWPEISWRLNISKASARTYLKRALKKLVNWIGPENIENLIASSTSDHID